MKNLIAHFDRHPMQAVLLLFTLFGMVATMDLNDTARMEAYQAGLASGMKLATEISMHDRDIGLQLADLCSQEWDNAPNAEQAKKRACGPL